MAITQNQYWYRFFFQCSRCGSLPSQSTFLCVLMPFGTTSVYNILIDFFFFISVSILFEAKLFYSMEMTSVLKIKEKN